MNLEIEGERALARSAIVTERSPPAASRLADWYRDTNLLDCFAVELPENSNSIRAIASAILGQPAPWFIKPLMSLQDNITRYVRRRTSDNVHSDTPDDLINSLPVLSNHDDELILGKDDLHMNFRISFMIQKSIDGSNLICTTTAVRCHDRLGRFWLAAIKPFHRLVVPSSLRKAATAGFASAEELGM